MACISISGKIQTNRLFSCRAKLFIIINLLARLDIILKCMLHIFKIDIKTFVIIQARSNLIPDIIIQ